MLTAAVVTWLGTGAANVVHATARHTLLGRDNPPADRVIEIAFYALAWPVQALFAAVTALTAAGSWLATKLFNP